MGFHTLPEGIRPKVNAISQLELELTYYDLTVPLLPQDSGVKENSLHEISCDECIQVVI